MTYVDSHSHLADPRLDEHRAKLIAEARGRGIGLHLQGGVGPEDWQRQLEIAQLFPEVLPTFGLHPYWVADHDQKSCEMALDQLSRMLNKAVALGETGLDFRPSILKDDGEGRARQIFCFEAQIELAEVAQKPIVLHIVKGFQEAHRVLSLFGVPVKGGFVHSFNGSLKEAEDYIELGLLLSVGGPLARASNLKLRQVVQEIPLEKLLLETDSPDQPGDQLRGQLNRPTALFDVAQVVADLKQKSVTEVLDITSQNCRKLLSL